MSELFRDRLYSAVLDALTYARNYDFASKFDKSTIEEATFSTNLIKGRDAFLNEGRSISMIEGNVNVRIFVEINDKILKKLDEPFDISFFFNDLEGLTMKNLAKGNENKNKFFKGWKL